MSWHLLYLLLKAVATSTNPTSSNRFTPDFDKYRAGTVLASAPDRARQVEALRVWFGRFLDNQSPKVLDNEKIAMILGFVKQEHGNSRLSEVITGATNAEKKKQFDDYVARLIPANLHEELATWDRTEDYTSPPEVLLTTVQTMLGSRIASVERGVPKTSALVSSELAGSSTRIPVPDSPPSIGYFEGRINEIAELDAFIDQRPAFILMGMSGIGKTQLLLKTIERRKLENRTDPDGLFYFTCLEATRNMRGQEAAERLLEKLFGFAHERGFSAERLAVLADRQQVLKDRVDALVAELRDRKCILFIDNFQDTLVPSTGCIQDQGLKALLVELLGLDAGSSRIIFVTALAWRDVLRTTMPVWPKGGLKGLSDDDAMAVLRSYNLSDETMVSTAIELVGGHPQALKWFSALADSESLSIASLVRQLSEQRSSYNTEQFRELVAHELMNKVWGTLEPADRLLLCSASVLRLAEQFDLLREVTGLAEADAMRARRTVVSRFLMDSVDLHGPHALHQLVRIHAEGQIKPEDRKVLHLNAAKAYQRAPRGFSLGDGDEAVYHLLQGGEQKQSDDLAASIYARRDDEGKSAWENRKYEDALPLIQKQLDLDVEDGPAIRHMAQALSRLGRPEAEQYFRKWLAHPEMFGKPSHGHMEYARFLEQLQRFEEAATQYRSVFGHEAENSYAIDRYSRIQFKLSQQEQQKYWNAVYYPKQTWVSLRNRYAALLLENDLIGEAELEWRATIVEAPEDSRAYRKLAAFLVGKGLPNEAVPLWDSGCRAMPRDASIRNDFANYLDSVDASAPAELLWEEAINLDFPGCISARLDFARYMERKGSYTRAKELWEFAISGDPMQVIARNQFADFCIRRSRVPEIQVEERERLWSEAERLWQEVIDIDPLQEYMVVGYVKFLVFQRKRPGDFLTAHHLLSAAYQEYFRSEHIISLYGGLLARWKVHHPEAKQVFENGIALYGENIYLRYAFARLLYSMEAYPDALAQTNHGLSLEDDSPNKRNHKKLQHLRSQIILAMGRNKRR